MGGYDAKVAAETMTENQPDIAACDHQRQLDHIDEMAHRIIGFLDQLEPHMPRLTAYLDSARAMRRAFGSRTSGR